MKWSWEKFGIFEASPDPTERLQSVLEESLPDEWIGKIMVVAMSREPGYAMMFAVKTQFGDATQPISLPPQVIGRIQREYGDTIVRVIRWSDDPQTLVRNALNVSEEDIVLLYDMIGRAIVLVQEHQVSRVIGPRGQNVRLASKVCGWDLEIMAANELDMQIRRAKSRFRELDGVTDVLADSLVELGLLSFDDLSVIEPDTLMRIGTLTAAQADAVIEQAEEKAERESGFE